MLLFARKVDKAEMEGSAKSFGKMKILFDGYW
jgi:hypothetical protein